jgi:hypothetical protein
LDDLLEAAGVVDQRVDVVRPHNYFDTLPSNQLELVSDPRGPDGLSARRA